MQDPVSAVVTFTQVASNPVAPEATQVFDSEAQFPLKVNELVISYLINAPPK